MSIQIENRNFLSPTGFKFSLRRSPKVAFFCNQANIPDINLGLAVQTSWLKDIEIPGDKIQFGDLNLRFLVDENLENYMEIQRWIRGLGYPESMQEFRNLEKSGKENGILDPEGGSVASMIIVKFGDATPDEIQALLGAGLVLFLLTLIVNLIANWIVARSSRERMA